jgi:hypothetical protein
MLIHLCRDLDADRYEAYYCGDLLWEDAYTSPFCHRQERARAALRGGLLLLETFTCLTGPRGWPVGAVRRRCR